MELNFIILNYLLHSKEANIANVFRLFHMKPHCDSGSSCSASDCNLLWTILATSLPTTSNSAMPLQLSQQCKFPFLGMGMRIAFTHSCGTRHVLPVPNHVEVLLDWTHTHTHTHSYSSSITHHKHMVTLY